MATTNKTQATHTGSTNAATSGSNAGEIKKSQTSEQDTEREETENHGGLSGAVNKVKKGVSKVFGQAKTNTTLRDLFEENLKDMYSAEKQLLKALPKVAEACYDEELQDAIMEHIEVTKKQVERLEKVFMRLRIDREEKTCEAMKGLIEENNQVIQEFEEGYVRDSALIIGSQKIEHYEIAAYGSLCELADVLGYYKISDLLGRSLEEEEDTDLYLTDIAQGINDEAYEMSQEEMHEQES